jgi:hypothetical protein
MTIYKDKLDYSIKDENYVKNLQDLLMECDGQSITVSKLDDGKFQLTSFMQKIFNAKNVIIEIKVIYDNDFLYNIELSLTPSQEDTGNYEMELKLFYLEEIKGALLDQVNSKKNKYTIRNYRAIYNSSPLKGTYIINGKYKIKVHALASNERDEPLTEHIICFDVELEERTIDRARSKAYNIISDFCSYLSILLDLGFHDVQSKFVNIIRTSMQGYEKIFLHERHRTAFCDNDLGFIVKDNMNGLCTVNELKQGIGFNGYLSIYNDDKVSHFKYGSLEAINKAFEKHRMYKVKDNNNAEFCEEINPECHYISQEILIPKQIRSYYRGIEKLQNDHIEIYKCFRNAARLYNKSHFLGNNDASIEISFLVASIEALAKYSKSPFTNFVTQYFEEDIEKKELDIIYAIRSKLFHAGEFSFFEYDFELDPYSDPLFIEFHKYYMRFKYILRKTIVSWVNNNILIKE